MLLKTITDFYSKPFITDLLYPFRYEDDVFCLIDGAFGIMWEIDGVNTDGKGDEDLQKISDTFSNFLKCLPEGINMQIIFTTWRGLDKDRLSIFKNGNLNNDYIREYMERKITWHDHGKKEGFATEGTSVFCPKTIKTYLTIKQASVSPGNLYTEDSFSKTRLKLKNIETIVESSLSSGGIKYAKVTDVGLIQLMYKFLNPTRSLDIQHCEHPTGDLRRHMIFNSPDASSDGWKFEDKKYSVISFKNNPAISGEDDMLYTSPNILFRDIGGMGLASMVPMMFFTMNIYIPSQEAVSKKLSFKRSMAFLHRMNALGDTAIDKEIAREETKKLLTVIYSGEKVVKVAYHLCIPTTEDVSDFLITQLVSYLNVRTGCNAFKEDLIAPGIFMRSLPFGFDYDTPDEARLVCRSITATTAIIADVAPIYKQGRGAVTETAWGMYNRSGEDLWFDPFDKNTSITSPHCILTGATGAGKSFSAEDWVHHLLRQPDSVVMIIDKGESYKNLCECYADGQYLKFEGNPDFVMDPFRQGDFTPDHRAFLVSLISSMTTGGYQQISREEVASISEAVLMLMDREDKSISGLITVLKGNEDPISKTVARKLFPFHGQGQYARFIESDKPSLSLSNRLMIAELGDLETHKDLQAIVVFLLIYYITEYVKKIPGRKYLLIDEAWSLFQNEVAVDFLVKAVKTFRKHGCSVIFITQQLEDFMVVGKAMNMKDNCPNILLLYQEGDVVLKNKEQLNLSQGEYDLYSTVKKSKKYAEIFFKTQGWSGIGRITLDPESYWVATTSEPDKVYLASLKKQGMTLRDAVKYAATQHPYGIAAGGSSNSQSLRVPEFAKSA